MDVDNLILAYAIWNFIGGIVLALALLEPLFERITNKLKWRNRNNDNNYTNQGEL